jgi:hypothetical protein
MRIRLFFHPFSYCREHVAVDLAVLISNSRMMENMHNVVHDLVNWNTWIFPCIENTPPSVSKIPQDLFDVD